MSVVSLGVLPTELSIHRLPATANLAAVIGDIDFSLATTNSAHTLFATLQSAQELSIVCDSNLVLGCKQTSGPWRAIRVLGQLDFALTGILSGITIPLAEANISIFAISSYDTDYILVRSEALPQAIQVLLGAGFPIAEVQL